MNRILRFVTVLILPLLMSVQVFAQSKYTIKGVVVDEMGPVIGATIVEKGTSNGIATDLNGEYSLVVASPEADVEISYIGYQTQTFKANAVPAKLLLQADVVSMADVVVIGYGSQKKKEVTGSVASLKAEDFNTIVQAAVNG